MAGRPLWQKALIVVGIILGVVGLLNVVATILVYRSYNQ
jgi:hypothetical protein